ncbi:MAG: Crp/Fnr family transcriptional regulator [Chitinophagaceae bacterium]
MQTDSCSYNCNNCPNCRISVFSDLKSDDMNLLNDEKTIIKLNKGQILFQQDTRPHGLYCIKKGKVKVFKTGSEGKEQIVRLANDADVVGYRSLLANDNYQCGATAIEETTLCFVPKETLNKLLQENISLYKKMITLLTEDLKEAETKISDLAQKPVRERVAETLLILKDKYGFEADGQTLNVVLSREEIANLVGTATESLIRILSDFKKEGLIELQNKKIKLLNTSKIFSTAHLYD